MEDLIRRPRAAFFCLCLILLLLPVSEATACTTFCLKRGSSAVFGKNYDWGVGDGLVVVNKRGVMKTAALPPQDKPARWFPSTGASPSTNTAANSPTAA